MDEEHHEAHGRPQSRHGGAPQAPSVAPTAVLRPKRTRLTAEAYELQRRGALNDAIVKIIGTDSVTVTNCTMLENAANTTTTAASNNMTEWGVAILYATATDNAQNATIQGNTIDLNRTYQNTFGIYANATHTAAAVTTSATGTGPTGGNTGLKIYANQVTDVNLGIVVVGPTAAADHQDNVEVGGTAPQGNQITNFGTTGTFSGYANVSGTVNGILVRNTRNFTIANNTVTSSAGGTTTGTLNGIHVPAFSVAPTGTFVQNINANIISLRSGLIAGAMNGITVPGTSSTATSTININANDFNNFGHTVAGSGTIQFISCLSPALITNINNNTFTNMTVNTTGGVTFIGNSVTHPANAVTTVSNNRVVTQFTKTGAGGTVNFYDSFSTSPATAQETNASNDFQNLSFTGATTINGWRSADGPTAGNGPRKTVQNNIFNNIGTGTSAATILNVSFSDAGSNLVTGNTVSNVTAGGAITGITHAGGTQFFSGNTVNGITSTGASAVVGMSVTGAVTSTLNANKIFDLSNSNAGGTVNGVLVSAGTTVNVQNNLIGDLRAPSASGANPVIGINLTLTTATSNLNVSFNSVFLNATSAGANFGSSAISHTTSATATTAALNMRNNVLVNTSTPAGTGLTVAYRRSSTTLTNYGSASNNNDFFAGTPSATNLLFADGTNFDQTLAAYKARVASRDSASVTENPPFLSTTGSSPQFLHINTTIATQLEGGGIAVAGIASDFDGDTRNASTPDIGADEFNGILLDLNGPSISYTPFLQTTTTTNRVLAATIAKLQDPAAYHSSRVRCQVGGKLPYFFRRNPLRLGIGAAGAGVDVAAHHLVYAHRSVFQLRHQQLGQHQLRRRVHRHRAV